MLISTQHLLVPPVVASPQPPSPSSQAFVLPPTAGGISVPPVPALPQLPSSLPPPPNVTKTHTTPIVVLPPPPQLTHTSSAASVPTTATSRDSPPPSITPASEPASSVTAAEVQQHLQAVAQDRSTPASDHLTPQAAAPGEPVQPSAGEYALPSRLPPIPTLFPPPPSAQTHATGAPLDQDVRMGSPPPGEGPGLPSNDQASLAARPNIVPTTMAPEEMIKQHFSNILPIPAGYKSVQAPTVYPGGYTIDVPLEASKLPLDVAIFNSARGSGGGGAPGASTTGGAIGGHEDKVRKYLQAVLIVGGASRVPGMTGALESR